MANKTSTEHANVASTEELASRTAPKESENGISTEEEIRMKTNEQEKGASKDEETRWTSTNEQGNGRMADKTNSDTGMKAKNDEKAKQTLSVYDLESTEPVRTDLAEIKYQSLPPISSAPPVPIPASRRRSSAAPWTIKGPALAAQLKINKSTEDTESKPFAATMLQRLNVKFPADSKQSKIGDITCFREKDIDIAVVLDANNSCVKSFWINDQPNQSRLKFNGVPQRLCKTDTNIVAVTFAGRKEISFIEVKPELAMQKVIHTQKIYHCLALSDADTFVAVEKRCSEIDIIDHNGNIKSVISGIVDQKKLFSEPWDLCTTRTGNIIISDATTKSISCLSVSGTLVFSVLGEDLIAPRGVTLSKTGDIFIVDRIDRKVAQLNKEGEYVKEVLTYLDGLKEPEAICIDDSERLCVSDKNTLLVFDIGNI